MRNLVSVITPTYNSKDTLEQCVASVRRQTYPHWEHIIIDDGSTDGSWNLLERLSGEDSRLRIIRQTNTGQAIARNKAISTAKGQYIALLDADDICTPERFEMQVSFLDKNPDIDVLGGGIVNISKAGDFLWIDKSPAEHKKLEKDIYRRNPFCTSSVMARAPFFIKTGGFPETIHHAEDYELWLRGYKQFKYHNLSVPLVFYRRDLIPRWRSALFAGWVLTKAMVKEKKPPYYLWYALRHLVATGAVRAGLKSATKPSSPNHRG